MARRRDGGRGGRGGGNFILVSGKKKSRNGNIPKQINGMEGKRHQKVIDNEARSNPGYSHVICTPMKTNTPSHDHKTRASGMSNTYAPFVHRSRAQPRSNPPRCLPPFLPPLPRGPASHKKIPLDCLFPANTSFPSPDLCDNSTKRSTTTYNHRTKHVSVHTGEEREQRAIPRLSHPPHPSPPRLSPPPYIPGCQ